ncbi:MAG: HK97 gp10 family phage protein, partial [Planctomycetaceae bacterium]|nr:HK97 gp10 family phage protein [Planctomycetaceae bacterium]
MTTITGDAQIDARLRHLSEKGAARAGRAAVNKGLKTIEKEIRSAAPEGETGGLKKAIGSRNKKRSRLNVAEAKTGIGVGKKKGESAPHSHLVALGTKSRKRKKIGGEFAEINPATDEQISTGTMPANPFVQQAFQ